MALLRRLYVKFIKNGWLSFSKRSKDTGTCYDKPLDSVKGWMDRFFWVDAIVCPIIYPWHTADSVEGDSVPGVGEYSEEEYNILTGNPAPFRRYPEAFLCWVGLSRNYPFKEDEYPVFRLRGEGLCIVFSFFGKLIILLSLLLPSLFIFVIVFAEISAYTFITHDDPGEVSVEARPLAEGESRQLDVTIDRVVSFSSPSQDQAEGELGVNNGGGDGSRPNVVGAVGVSD